MPKLIDFAENQGRLFGRAPHLAYLRERAAMPGITAVIARPQAGKTWLMRELARLLTEKDGMILGYHESKGGGADNILRAVQDLYTRWLSDSTYREQAKQVYRQQKGKLLGGAAKMLGTIFADDPSTPKQLGKAVELGLQGLVQANADLKNGGMTLPTLQYDQAQDLLSEIHAIRERPLILLLDAWEQTAGNLEGEQKLLAAFVKNIGDWPPCHIFVVLRPESPAVEHVMELERESPAQARQYELPRLELSAGQGEDELIGYLHTALPAADKIPRQTLLELIDGHPGVIKRWLEENPPPEKPEDFARIAHDAHIYRYRELESLCDAMDSEQRSLAMRLALLDKAGIDHWSSLKDTILNGQAAEILDSLFNARILENNDPPSYGHAKRAEAARETFARHHINAYRRQINSLMENFAEKITSTDKRTLPFAEAILTLEESSPTGAFSRESQILLESCRSLLTLPANPNVMLNISRLNHGTILVAMVLFNTLNQAKEEQALERRDALLSELRELARQHGEAPIREHLAKGLANTLNQAKDEQALERRDALLDELRELARQHDDAPIRGPLARGLFNTLIAAKDEQALERRDALLDELRELARQHDDAPIREHLAMGLFNTLNDAKDEQALERRDALLDEFRELARQHDDASIREPLAKGLFNVLNQAKDEQALERRDALLDELRELAHQYDEAPIREQLAMGLFNTLNNAKSEGALERRDALLDELRELAREYDETPIREQLAMGLFNTLVDAKEEQALERRDALLDELRELAREYDQAPIREHLAKGLLKTLIEAKNEGDSLGCESLLKELRELAESCGDEWVGIVLEFLAEFECG